MVSLIPLHVPSMGAFGERLVVLFMFLSSLLIFFIYFQLAVCVVFPVLLFSGQISIKKKKKKRLFHVIACINFYSKLEGIFWTDF